MSFKRTGVFSCAICVATGLGASSADAQAPRFRVTDLGVVGAGDESRAFGVNSLGQVVGQYKTAGGEIHAFLWLPEADYGLAQGMHDLNTVADPDITGPSVAHDINEGSTDAYIVGQADDHAFVWDLDSLGDTMDLGTLSGDPGDSSIAYAVNDRNPPVVVGASEDGVGGINAFRFINGNTMAALPPPLDCGVARDVTNAPDALGSHIVGVRYTGTCDFDGDPCVPTRLAMFWRVPGAITMLSLNAAGAEALGANDSDQIVGWGRDPLNPSCFLRALYWEDTASQPVNLGNLFPALQETRAEAINNLDPPQVVGTNVTISNAILWEQDAGAQWEASNLNDDVDANCDWVLAEAEDVNDDGWIVGSGVHDGAIRAFVLSPLGDCPEDINGDGVVNGADVTLLRGSWGSCPVGIICEADVNADCNVGPSDLIQVLGAFGPCPGGEGGAQGGDPQLWLEQTTMALGFQSAQACCNWLAEADEWIVV